MGAWESVNKETYKENIYYHHLMIMYNNDYNNNNEDNYFLLYIMCKLVVVHLICYHTISLNLYIVVVSIITKDAINQAYNNLSWYIIIMISCIRNNGLFMF